MGYPTYQASCPKFSRVVDTELHDVDQKRLEGSHASRWSALAREQKTRCRVAHSILRARSRQSAVRKSASALRGKAAAAIGELADGDCRSIPSRIPFRGAAR